MNCPKCNGLMLFERFVDGTEHFFGWRCLLCGLIVDEVVLKNRRAELGNPNELKTVGAKGGLK